MIRINAMGEACPLPVVKTLRALQSLGGAGSVETLVDNETAVQNLRRLAESKGCSIEVETISDAEYRVTITAAEGAELPKEEAIACTAPAAQKKTVVIISTDHMGEGNEELGRALLKAFLFALTQQETLPAAILFYNAGAAVTCEGSASLEDLQALQSQGVEILTCGTCLNYYGLTEKLRVGEVTNMYVIAEKQLQATASSAREPIKLPGHPQDDRAVFMRVMDLRAIHDRHPPNQKPELASAQKTHRISIKIRWVS